MNLLRRLLPRRREEGRRAPQSTEAVRDTDALLLSGKIEPGTRLAVFLPDVSDTVGRFLDLDALAHEADTTPKERQRPRTLSLPASSIWRYLRADVTQREVSLLTVLLSHLGECCVEIPAQRDSGGSTVRQAALVRIVSDRSWGNCSKNPKIGQGEE